MDFLPPSTHQALLKVDTRCLKYGTMFANGNILFFTENRIWHWRQFAWNIKSCFLGKIRKCITSLSSVELAKIMVKVNFTCGIRSPYTTSVCYQSVCHSVRELGSRAACHYLLVVHSDGQVISHQKKSKKIVLICDVYNKHRVVIFWAQLLKASLA